MYSVLRTWYTSSMYAAVDIGGTKTLIAVFDKEKNIVQQHKFPTNHDYELFKIDLAKAVAELSTSDFSRAVVAVPGRIDRKHGIAFAFGNLDWVNLPLQKDLEHIFNAPVLLENDAKLASLSEAILLAKSYRKVLYVTISTGIGAGLITNGKIDPNFEDMEAGQMLLEHNGKLKQWEDFGSGKAFQTKFGKRVSDVAGDDTAAWYWFARNIAIGLVNLIAIVTPEVIVIGGGAGAHLEKYQARLEEQLKIYENPMFLMPPIVKAKHAEEAVIYGCYEYAKQHKK